MEWVHKTFINSLGITLEFKGASPRERLKPTEEEKGQAGRPKGVEPAGLLPVGLHFFGFFFCEFFDASQAYVLLNFALDSTVLSSKYIYTIYRSWSRRCFTKRCFWLRVDIQRRLQCSRYRNSECMDRMASKREIRKNTEWSAS